MDRERLKQVQQTDLTESRLNQDLVDWLKNRGPTYLLVILVVLVGFIAFHRFREYRAGARSAAFADLDMANKVESFKEVALDHGGQGSVAELAHTMAGDLYLYEVQSRRDVETPEETLTPEQVEERRAAAREQYQTVLDETSDDPARVLLQLQALFGLAAIAESGETPNFDEAAKHYEQARDRAKDQFPKIASQAESRLASLDALRAFEAVPTQADMPVRKFIDPLLEGVFVENGLEPS